MDLKFGSYFFPLLFPFLIFDKVPGINLRVGRSRDPYIQLQRAAITRLLERRILVKNNNGIDNLITSNYSYI